jgi:acetylornithine deacetylase/succinyl-diaminopimelate desuccinylase-like protein
VDEAIERVIGMRRFRSTASEWAVAGEDGACAEWFVEELRSIGFSASVRDMPGRPIAVGHDRGLRGPSVLFCCHYEARPGGLSRGNRSDEGAYSSIAGAVHQCCADQSIQLMAFVEACRAWKAVAGQLPGPVSVLVEGEGRPESVRLASFVRMYADELKADVSLAPAARVRCCAKPTINSMLHGLCREDFTITADGDQPVGRHRGVAAAPALVLARILGDLHDSSGRVAIPGFYAGIDAPLRPPCDRRSGASGSTGDLPRAEDQAAPGGGRDEGRAEAIPVWPTCEINDVNASRGDSGRRRQLPPRASARLTFNLVSDQDPDVVRQIFRDFARTRVPPGTQIEFVSGTSAPPTSFTASNPIFRKVQRALTAEWGREANFACGDALPAVHALHETLGMEAIVVSFPKRQDGCRRPPETSELAKNYRIGVRSWARILDALAR